jgi:glycosyltransferase involved in cell wall biosynthesis
MRILVAHHVPRPRTGGMSRIMGYIHDQIERTGAIVDYFTAEDVPQHYPRRASRIAFPLLAWRFASAQRRAGRGYDIINVHEPSAAPLACWRGHGASVIVTTHGVEQRGWESALADRASGRPGPSPWTRTVYPATSLWQSRVGLMRADHVFCLSEQDREYLQQRLHLLQPRITRIFPGAQPVFAMAAADRDYGNAQTLLFAGTWLPRKGIADLVIAFEALHHSGRRPHLVVLGPGVADRVVLASFPPELRPYVRCVTAADDRSAAEAFAASDVFVLPSVFEGTPLTLIEAMMSGLPIVTTATAGMRDVIEDSRTGLLVNVHAPAALARALRSLLDDEPRRAALGRAARRAATERHSWEFVSRPVLAVYERLIAIRPAA